MSLIDQEMASLPYSLSRLRTLSDEDLMVALCANYNDALAVLFERHSALAFRIARATLRDDGEAEETVQRVFLDIYRSRSQFNRERGTFTIWLLQYAYHRSFNRRAHLQANHFYDLYDLDDLAPTELFYGAGRLLCLPRQEVVCLVKQALAILESHQRKVIELTYFEGLTAMEIAEKTGDSASSVRHHLYRGMKKVRDTLLETKRARSNAASERNPSPKGMLVEYPRTL
ncbi:MAG: polymerase sigma factor, sigma-70 family [Edaphobacter sp.]|nr:polymerase sigma factor, sigma-70 family [Edaphobacter sp.]